MITTKTQKVINDMVKFWVRDGGHLADYFCVCDGLNQDMEILELHKLGKATVNVVIQEAIMKELPEAIEGIHGAIENEVSMILQDQVYEYQSLQETQKQLEEHRNFLASLSKEQLLMFNKLNKGKKPKGRKKAHRPGLERWPY